VSVKIFSRSTRLEDNEAKKEIVQNQRENKMTKHLALLTLLCSTFFAYATPDDILVIVLPSEIITTDPLYADTDMDEVVRGNVYEGLVTTDGTLAPLLSTNWETSEDGTQYTFTLRDNVAFHTGKAMTCEDAAYSLRSYLVITGKPAFSYAVTGYKYWDDEEGLLDNTPFSVVTEAIYCDDQQRLIIKLLNPSPESLKDIAELSIVDQEFTVAQGGWSGTEADWKDWANTGEDPLNVVLNGVSAGTGAYQLISFEVGRSVFQRFESYWGEPASIETVVLQTTTDTNSRILALTSGDADAIYGVPGTYAGQLEGTPGVVAAETAFPYMEYLVFNQNFPDPAVAKLGSGKLDGQGIPADFFSDVNVRRAFLYAFDDQFIIDEVFKGRGRPSNFVIPSYLISADFADATTSSYNLERATEAFKLAWDGQVWENGFTLTMGINPDAGLEHHEFALTILKDRIESLNPKFRLQLETYVGGEDPYQDMLDQAPLYIDYWFRSLTAGANVEKFFEDFANALNDDTLLELSDQVQSAKTTDEQRAVLETLRDHMVDNASLIVYPEHGGSYYYSDTLNGVTISPFNDAGILWKSVSK
jgi:peptide/nickel transport system substrate-binding protein